MLSTWLVQSYYNNPPYTSRTPDLALRIAVFPFDFCAEMASGTSLVSESVSNAEATSGTFLHIRPSKAFLSKIRPGDRSMYIVALPIFSVVEVSRLH